MPKEEDQLDGRPVCLGEDDRMQELQCEQLRGLELWWRAGEDCGNPPMRLTADKHAVGIGDAEAGRRRRCTVIPDGSLYI